jgi:hypothetical protein
VGAWFVAKVLPSVVSSLITVAVVGLSHVRLRRHITRTADKQTAELTGSDPKGAR